MTPALAALMGAISISAALIALALQRALNDRRDPAADSLLRERAQGAVFLFDGDTLVDATSDGRALLAGLQGDDPAWQRLLRWIAARFPGADGQLERLQDLGRISQRSSADGATVLVGEWRSGLRRISLLETGPAALTGRPFDHLAQRAMDDELASLRQIAETAPCPTWQEDAQGHVLWANRAALDLVNATAQDTRNGWTPPLRPLAVEREGRVATPGGTDWFDCRIIEHGPLRTVHAIPVGAAVQAERALSSLMQTLTRTFAHLTIGLAIFDRHRRLQVFNPALPDLTRLPVDFLSSRPSLFAVLDTLRERGMVPEPKDYKAWRNSVTALEQGGGEGSLQETWALPNGLTYRATIRTQPEGALALLLEDVTDEITRTRRIRADLEIAQSVIDTSDEAMAVFSASGQLMMVNTAYVQLWQDDPMDALTDQPLAALVDVWRSACAPSPFWNRALAFAGAAAREAPVDEMLRRNDGRRLRCRLAPLAGGATLIAFLPDPGGRRLPPAPAETPRDVNGSATGTGG